MVHYSRVARSQVDSLIVHYRTKQRPEAIRNLNRALAEAEAEIEAGPKRPRRFPATYSDLYRPGVAWLRSRSYWIGYQQTIPPVIIAVFWDRAAIDRRYPASD